MSHRLIALFGLLCLLFCSVSALTSYQITSQQQLDNGWQFELALSPASAPGPYGVDISPLRCTVAFETGQRVRVRLFDPNNTRYEVPSSVLPQPSVDAKIDVMDYAFTFDIDPFQIQITRKSDNHVLLDTSAQLIFEDQYIELTTRYAPSSTIVGFGERVRQMPLDHAFTHTLWNIDSGTPANQNLYGFHPFYMETLLDTHQAHGVFMRSSNGMDVELTTDGYLTYRIVGGIIDLTVFTGPNPADVVKQYHNVIGTPHMPPFWSLGFHQCRWGYHDLSMVKDVVDKYAAAQIPLDTIWSDIDYMNNYLDFTWDPVRFPSASVAEYVAQLHARGQHYVVIVDPGISNTSALYAPYVQGRQQNVFIQRASGGEFHGKVWPGYTAFPDWFAANASSWWRDQIQSFVGTVPYDGLWIDMNEISNFCTGDCDGASKADDKLSFNPNNPPYWINNRANFQPLNTNTIDMDCPHGNDPSLIEYNTHNLFGMMEGIATQAALESIQRKRSLVISRSTYAGAGHHTGHWLGDNDSTFISMQQSIAGILNMGIFGIPLVGADICGFNKNTTEELCARWMAVGAFYPFARNHNSIGQMSQEPYLWQSVTQISRKALGARYSLLSYMHTHFYVAHRDGGMLARALFLEFPADPITHPIDAQFMLGPALLISPVLQQGVSTVTAYFPPSARWFDWWTFQPLAASGWVTLPAPWSTINVHLRSGQIAPRQPGATAPWSPSTPLTSQTVRSMPFELIVVPDQQHTASGSLYLDDGVEVSVGQNSAFILFSCSLSSAGVSLTSSPQIRGALDPISKAAAVQQLSILGQTKTPSYVSVNGVAWKSFTFGNGVVTITGLSLPLVSPFQVDWQ